MIRWLNVVMEVIQNRPHILSNVPTEEWQKLDFFLENTEKRSDDFENTQWKLKENETFIKLISLLFLYGDRTTIVPAFFAPNKTVQKILTLARTEYLVSKKYEGTRPKSLSMEILTELGYANISRDEEAIQTPAEAASALRRVADYLERLTP